MIIYAPFLAALGLGSTEFCFRAIYEAQGAPAGEDAYNFYGTIEQHQTRFSTLQDQGYGIYIVVNGGGHTDSEITWFRACMIDWDGYKGEPPPTFHLPPSMSVWRADGNAAHFYWLLHAEATDATTYTTVQKQLSQHYNTDAIGNPSRVLRVPGFWNMKAEPLQYISGECLPELRYSLAQVRAGLVDVAETVAASSGVTLDELTSAPIEGYGGPRTDAALIKALCNKKSTAAVAFDPTKFSTGEMWRGDVDPSDASALVWALLGDVMWYTGHDEQRTYDLISKSPLLEVLDDWDPDNLEGAQKWTRLGPGQVRKSKLSLEAALEANPGRLPCYKYSPPLSESAHPEGLGVGGISAYGYSKNDHAGNAALFLSRCYQDVPLVHSATAGWLEFDGKVWVPVSGEACIQQQVQRDLSAGPKVKGFDVTDALANGTYKCLRRECHTSAVPAPLLDKMVFDNGVLDLDTWDLHPHDPQHFTTHILPYAWDPKAECPNWLAQLEWAFSGDKGRVKLCQQIFAAVLYRKLTVEKAFLLVGPGRGGKGTMLELIERMLGEGQVASFEDENIADPTTMYRASQAAALVDSDLSIDLSYRAWVKMTATIKRITGGGNMTVKKLYTDTKDLPITARILLASNELPRVADHTGAVATRFIILPFGRGAGDHADTRVKARILAEAPGVLCWALGGLHDLLANGFDVPAASVAELKELRAQSNPVGAFLEDTLVWSTSGVCMADALFEAWGTWQGVQGYEAFRMSRNLFTRRVNTILSAAGVPRCATVRDPQTGTTRRGWHGFTLGAPV